MENQTSELLPVREEPPSRTPMRLQPNGASSLPQDSAHVHTKPPAPISSHEEDTMKRSVVIAVLGMLTCVLAGCALAGLLSPQATEIRGAGWDHAAFVEYLRGVFEPMDSLLAQTGDELDFERFRFFSGKNLNGADETVVIIPLNEDCPSYRLALLDETEVPLADIAPLPYGGFLALDPCDCFSAIENGVPYLLRVVSYEQAEMVDANGKFIRPSTTFSWLRGGNEPEWYKFLGNVTFHFNQCITTGANQG